MVKAIRETEAALGSVNYELSPKMIKSRQFSRSLFTVKDVRAGELFTGDNVSSIRPGFGLPPKYLKGIIGKKARQNLKKGTPLCWEHIIR